MVEPHVLEMILSLSLAIVTPVKVIDVNRYYKTYFNVCKTMSVYIVDCSWSEWTAWGACSATCNGGTQDRVRVITMEESGGGNQCTGDNIDFQSCMTDPCPGKLINVNQD